jgi:hypothetical protein
VAIVEEHQSITVDIVVGPTRLQPMILSLDFPRESSVVRVTVPLREEDAKALLTMLQYRLDHIDEDQTAREATAAENAPQHALHERGHRKVSGAWLQPFAWLRKLFRIR